jgi:MFS family permease
MLSLIVSIMEVGAFFGSIFTAFAGERLGRRKTIATSLIIMIIGSLVQAITYNRAHMIVDLVVAGFGLRIVNSTVPVMMAEFAPKDTRGLRTSHS